MANSSILSASTTTASALAGLILVTPEQIIGYQPQETNIINFSRGTAPSLLFHYEGEQSATLTSDITDHFVEDNTAIQDQISLKPVEISTRGFIGELNDIAPLDLIRKLDVVDKLTLIGSYTPVLSTTALIAYANAFQAYQIAQSQKNSEISAWSTITGASVDTVLDGSEDFITLADLESGLRPNQNKQQIAFQQFYGYWTSRVLFTIQTPWAVFKNMAIKTLRAVQSEETRVISDFEIVFKQMRFATTVTAASGENSQGRNAVQTAPLTDLGTSTPVPSISVDQGLSQNFPEVR